jgi:hypothetical protein
MHVLTDTCLARANRPNRLTQALLPSMPRRGTRRRAIHVSKARLFPWLPSIRRYRAAVCLCRVQRARGARRGLAVLLLWHGQEVRLEGGEFERRLRTGIARRRGRHRDSRSGV